MTTASALITDAYREANIIPINTSPSTAQQTEGLNRLNRFIKSLYGYENGENLADWIAPAPQRTAPVAANYPQSPVAPYLDGSLINPMGPDPSANVYPYPPKNSRIVFGGVTLTVYFPEAPADGSRMAVVQGSGAGDSGAPGAVLTLDGNGRTIQTSNTKTLTDPISPTVWFYRADLGDWTLVADMALTDQFFLPAEFEETFICWLAKRLAPSYSKIISKETDDIAKAGMARLKARYRQSAPTTYKSEDIPNSYSSFRTGLWQWGW